MNEIRKYNEIKIIREQIRDLSLSLGEMMNILDNESINKEFKKETEHQAWKLVSMINEISKKSKNHGSK